MYNTTIEHEEDKWTITTGEIVTTFSNIEAAAIQVALLQGYIVSLKKLLLKAQKTNG